MTVATGLRGARGINRRLLVIHREDTVPVVATDAGGDLCIAGLLEFLAVTAGPVFRFLIRSGRGVVVPHEGDVRVAVPAEIGHLFRRGDAAEAGVGSVVEVIVQLRVAPVAV